ncbi:MAG: hypothetical protein ACSHX0_11125 [Akkermansiaceae bacterium]
MNSTLITTLTSFLDEIGIPHGNAHIPDGTSVPGIKFSDGKLLIDAENLTYPGDILYKAGLLATADPSERSSLVCVKKPDAAHETSAMAWAYAAAVHLQIDPQIVFHEGGYQDGGQQIIAQFQGPQAFGVPMLLWYQMCETYPHMTNWLRTANDPANISLAQ